MIMKALLVYNRCGDVMKLKIFTLGEIRSKCYILYEEGLAFVIDPGYESDEVLSFLDEEKLIVVKIYLTHGHPDHVGGVKRIKDIYDAVVYAPEKDKIWLKMSVYNRIGYEIPVDVWVKDLDMISFIGQEFVVYETPGHSMGSTVLYGQDLLFSGDTLFFQSIGRTDIPLADSQALYKSVKRIYQLFTDETVVYPGHGKPTTIGHEKEFNPFVRK
ncbi:MAG: MBL fold metallo-hydrolase [Bacillota bacterium]|nr:MAG: MBL fold metallo-hydrolase [Bacillota bacterium]